jgi:serine/threonine-protein kinase
VGVGADEAFDHLLDDILDGAPIDWASAGSTTADADPDLLDELKVLAAVAEVHRSAAAPIDPVIARGRWGHLRVLELIGRGAHGAVYRAWDPKLDREVALKLLAARTDDGAPASDAVIEEGRVLARVRHPNVVTLYGADLIDGYVGLWMERVAGRTLEELVKEGKEFSVAEIAAIGVELCQAVAAVHDAGLVHRDIKAANVMIGDDGRAVLMDFGTGREVEEAGGALAGTPLYLAPELFGGGHPSPRSDVYSIGVLLYRLLTGSYPVVATDLADLRRAHVEGERTRVRDARADAPARLASVLDRALDPDPEHRYPSAQALGSELGAIARPRSGRFARTIAVAMTLALVMVAVWGIRNAVTDDGRGPIREPITSWSGSHLGADAGIEAPSIAVLLFDEPGGSSDDDHFAFGLASEILHELARVDGLSVRSAGSSFSFDQRPHDLAAIQERLHVDYAVTGSVRRTADRLRVSAQLVDLVADRAVWADRFDRPFASSMDVFAITDEIARAIVNELRLTLGAGQRRYDLDPSTYDLYLQARAESQFRTTSQEPPFGLYQRIIERDPTFAPAWAGLADLYFRSSLPSSAGFQPPARGRQLPFEAAMSATHGRMGLGLRGRNHQARTARQ